MEIPRYYATGKRKTAVARVWVMPGEGKITVNKRDIDKYFPRMTSRMIIHQPLEITKTDGKFDIQVGVRGGGLSAQAEAIKYGISKALLDSNPDFRKILKKAGFLTRDTRIVERKKYGRKKARKSFQYSKR